MPQLLPTNRPIQHSIGRPTRPRRHLQVAALLVSAGAAWLSASGIRAQERPASPGATNPHGAIDIECSACHTVEGWTPLRSSLDFDHDATGFPLEEAHAAAGCGECHADLSFARPDTVRDCVDCHRDAYDATLDPDHRGGGLPTACWACHGQRSFTPAASFDHAATGFLLEGSHRALECAACHPSAFAATEPQCVSCHEPDYVATTEPDHAAADLGPTCDSCHSTTAWQPARFDHDRTAFPLLGAHRGADCAACHVDGFAGTPSECLACHQTDFQGAGDPDHVAAGFDTACETCHGVTGWQPARFDHSQTTFPLQGGHRDVECVACHADGFTGTSSECLACHRVDYESTVDPDHVAAAFDTECESCHTTTGWQPATFDHAQTRFALDGAHGNLDCQACHADGYTGTPTDCFACHADDFRATVDPDHVAAGFETACDACHDVAAWQPATFDHAQTAFALTGGHRDVDCVECHADGYVDTPTDCFTCHADDFHATAEPSHVAAGFETACESCHEVAAWQPATFDHATTAFALTGGHRDVGCAECHADGYVDTPTDCFACHVDDFERVSDPDHAEAGFPTACEACHTDRAWTPATFDHDRSGFALDGAHARADCSACHAERFSGTPDACVACHQGDAAAALDPDHSAAGFSDRCESCHGTQTWSPTRFDHSGTGFRLDGAHAQSDCVACHADGYTETPATCVGCHRDRYDETTDPPHGDAGFSLTCEACHSTTAWRPATSVDHDATAFPLRGAHARTDCTDCHAEGYAGTPTDCFACHRPDYEEAATPEHARAGFSTACETCHSVQAWSPADFEHGATGFALDGAHAQADCASCHAEGYAGTPAECVSCHRAEYQSAADPDHERAGFGTSCETCHSTTAWRPASSVDHDATAFPLRGAHARTDCAECHADGYAGTPTDCFACHLDDYEQASSPEHAEAGFPTACESCHSVQAWSPAEFDHGATGFPLDGAHARADCTSCHAEGYAGTPTDCFACHEADFRATSDPSHVSAGFPTRCEACHSTRAWEPAEFDHTRTAFPLDGAHSQADCVSCHADGYAGTPTDCFACHEERWNQTTDPPHAAAGFPTACETCHTTRAWSPATFDHQTTAFPLRGEHRTLDCVECHADGYVGTPADCVACHREDYDTTNDPDHAAAGFPTTCETCHDESGWDGATWDHDLFFPIDSGPHREAWSACSDCHPTPGNFRIFQCTLCHERSQADRDHDEVSGYVYESRACLECHPDGDG